MKFWMVHVAGTNGVVKKHTSLEAAQKEAIRLAGHYAHPKVEVFVLESVEKAVGRVDVEVTSICS